MNKWINLLQICRKLIHCKCKEKICMIWRFTLTIDFVWMENKNIIFKRFEEGSWNSTFTFYLFKWFKSRFWVPFSTQRKRSKSYTDLVLLYSLSHSCTNFQKINLFQFINPPDKQFYFWAHKKGIKFSLKKLYSISEILLKENFMINFSISFFL